MSALLDNYEDLDETIRTILDVVCGVTRFKADAEKLTAIEALGRGAIERSGVQVKRTGAE